MESQELANIPNDGSPVIQSQTEVQYRIDTMLANREHVIQKVTPLLIDGVDVYTIPNTKPDAHGRIKKSLGKPGAEKLAAIFNLAVSFEIDRETMDAIGPTLSGRRYVAYKAIVTSGGIFKGEGRGAAFIEDMRNAYKNIYQSQFTALTEDEKAKCQGPYDGTRKSDGKPYTYWRMPDEPVFDPLALNKTIKMAQKSAFGDGIIRVTGMSDLFTQDVEDMSPDQFEPPKAEPKPPTTPPPAQEAPKPAEPVAQEVKQAVPVSDGPQVLCTVADCGGVMKQRNGSKGPFYGCSNYTAKGCKASMNVHEYDATLAKAELASGWDNGLGESEIRLEDIPF